MIGNSDNPLLAKFWTVDSIQSLVPPLVQVGIYTPSYIPDYFKIGMEFSIEGHESHPELNGNWKATDIVPAYNQQSGSLVYVMFQKDGDAFITDGGNCVFVVHGGYRDYYKSLITSEYQLSTKFMGFVTMLANLVDDCLPAILEMYKYFDLDKATGQQLDSIGQIVGASRYLPFQPSGSVSPILGDDDYRRYIRARIVRNTWDGQIQSLVNAWRSIFPGGNILITDNQNMSMNVFLTGAFNSLVVDMINNDLIVPHPEGVLVNYEFGTMPFFGFDLDNFYVAGFDKGHLT